MNKRCMTVNALSALLLTLVARQAGAAEDMLPAVLNEVPADAHVVFVVRDMKALANKVSNTATRMNLPVPQDPIGAITQNIGIKGGLDQNGSVAVVLLPKAARNAAGEERAEEKGTPDGAIILPATDPKVLLAPYKPQAAEKGVSELTMPGGDKGFAGVSGKYVIIAPEREHVQQVLAKKAALAAKLAPEAARAFAANDVVMYANMPEVNKSYRKKLEEFEQGMLTMMDLQQQAAGDDGVLGTKGMQREVVALIFGTVNQFLSDASYGLVTLKLTDAGLTFGATGNFRSDTPMAQFVAGQKLVQPPSLKGLPNDQALLVAGAAAWDSKSGVALFEQVRKAMQLPAPKDNDAKKPAVNQQALDSLAHALTGASAANFALYAPPAGGRQGWLYGAALTEAADPAKYIQTQLQDAKARVAAQSAPGVKLNVTTTENATTVKGIKLHKLEVKPEIEENNPMGPMIKQMYGPEGLTAYLGVVGKRALSVLGNDMKLVESAITAAQTNSEALAGSKEIVASKAQLPRNPVLVVYMPAERWISMARKAAEPAPAAPGNDKPVRIAGPAGGTPVVMSVGVDGSSASLEVFVPMSTIISIGNLARESLPFLFGGGAME